MNVEYFEKFDEFVVKKLKKVSNTDKVYLYIYLQLNHLKYSTQVPVPYTEEELRKLIILSWNFFKKTGAVFG